ncbi:MULTISPECIES: HAD family hydrolase [Gordonia]|uniref:HAD family phosphatase n=1 Tax=Gordonia amicalis TaxID=89053 RepID=A0ABU4DCG9_9ACTN|nr:MULTISPECIES: HAD family phosphatase [Gordonia]MBA5847426.1 HAD family phosphatase [Gordonia amicalis]MDV6307407.1 HAD family phosphatase [Gordonia amicalis]MDV7101231.1 HAD family phosphatase [Gordonia amicalis]MDV7175859.1 HAD family phosphatase [Gordonia amicalis]NKX79760.1 HAD family phosphatase [Gordonia amicalis]
MSTPTPGTTTATIRAIVFDWSGVLTESPLSGLRRYSAELGLPETALHRFVRGDQEFAKVERGELSVRDFLKGVCVRVHEEHGVDVEIRRLGAAMADTRTLRQPMLELVAELSGRYTLAVLTNNVAENRDHLASTLPLDHFDFILNSADVGVRKPDPLIYRELLRRLGCDGSEVVYIDDFAENLPPAADLGMATIEFTDPDELRARLAELGI